MNTVNDHRNHRSFCSTNYHSRKVVVVGLLRPLMRMTPTTTLTATAAAAVAWQVRLLPRGRDTPVITLIFTTVSNETSYENSKIEWSKNCDFANNKKERNKNCGSDNNKRKKSESNWSNYNSNIYSICDNYSNAVDKSRHI